MHSTSLTFAVGKIVGTRHTRVTPQPCHTGPAAALPAAGVAGRVQRAIRGAVAGWGEVGVGTPWGREGAGPGEDKGGRGHLGARQDRRGQGRGAAGMPLPPTGALTGAVGEAVEAGTAFLAGGARVARSAVACPTRGTELVQGAPGITGTGCKGCGVRSWVPAGGPPAPAGLCSSPHSPWQWG